MKLLVHNDLTPFEHACTLGNLSALKIALINQSPDVNNSIYLNGLLISIENQRTNIFRYLIGLDSYKIVLSRYYAQIKNQIKEHGPFFLLSELEDKIYPHECDFGITPSCYLIKQIAPPIFENEKTETQQLNDDEITFINQLSAYYESSLSGQTLETHLQALKNELAKHYQAQPAIHEELSLPLDLETFKFINRFVSEDIQNQMLETYYQHPIHTAWRFVASSQTWDLNTASPQKSFNICQHEASSLLILVWFASKDNDFPHAERRLAHFFHTLANINREGNRQKTQISFELIEDNYRQHEVSIDDLQWDIPCSPNQLKKKLLSAIIEHPTTSRLSLDKLYDQALNFITDHWIKLIWNLSLEQYLMLKYYFDKICIDPDITPPDSFF